MIYASIDSRSRGTVNLLACVLAVVQAGCCGRRLKRKRVAKRYCFRYAKICLTTLPCNVGQAVVAALEAEGQAFVVEAEQVQDRGLQVVDVDLVLGDREAELVGLAVASSRPSRRRRPATW